MVAFCGVLTTYRFYCLKVFIYLTQRATVSSEKRYRLRFSYHSFQSDNSPHCFDPNKYPSIVVCQKLYRILSMDGENNH